MAETSFLIQYCSQTIFTFINTSNIKAFRSNISLCSLVERKYFLNLNYTKEFESRAFKNFVG